MRRPATRSNSAGWIRASAVLAYLCALTSGGEPPEAQVRDVSFALCREIPVDLMAGTPDHPRLVEIQWIRIEPKQLPRGVTARVGWSPAAEATWRISVDLLDDRGGLLRDGGGKEVIFAGKATGSAKTGMHYADLDLGYKSFQTRRYATKVRVRLERVNGQRAGATAGEPAEPAVQIKVIDGKSRKPLADVEIVAQAYYTDKTLRSEVFLCSTDAEGVCRIAGLKPASISFTTQKEGYGMMLCSVPSQSPAQPAPGPKVVELRPAQPIGGVVQDQDGKPIADVDVRINVNSSEVGGMGYLNRIVRTDKDGRWRVEGVLSKPDTVALELHHLEYLSGYDWKPLADQLPAAQAFKHVEHMTRGASVNGRVLNAEGQPVPRAAVTLAPPRRGGFQYGYAGVLTDASGRFHFGCAKDMRGDKNTGGGPTAIYVEAPGYAPMMKKLFIEPNVPPLEFRLSAGRAVTIRTVSSDGQPILGASVQLYPLAEDPGNSLSLKMTTDEQGRLQVAQVPEGEMRMTVEKRGYLTVKDHVLPASGAEYSLTMAPGARVSGTVSDAETGQPIPSFKAYLRDATDLDIVWFSESGEFREGKYEFALTRKASVDLRLAIGAPGYKWARSDAFRLEEGTRQIDFKLEKDPLFAKRISPQPSTARVIRGTVQDPNGRPAAHVAIATCPYVASEMATDAEGRFKLLYVPSMRWPPGAKVPPIYIVARDTKRNLAAAVLLDETLAGDLTIRLGAGVVVTGRVVDPEGKGVPRVGLLPLFHSGSGYAQGLPGVTKSDPNGCFEVRALPGGHRYTVRATAHGYGDGFVEFSTAKAVANRLELKPLVLLPTDQKVSGIVVNSEGKPVPGADVFCYDGGQPTRHALADAQGRFLLEGVCAGPITIYCRGPGKDARRHSVQAKAGDTDVRIVLTDSGLPSGPQSDIVP
jgi:hypothetical protein